MVRLRRAARPTSAIALSAVLSACATSHSFNDVEIARSALLGFTQEDIRMCAGFPNRMVEEGNTAIWSYESTERSGGVNLSAPVFFGAASTNLSLPSGGSCRAQFRFVDGLVDRIAYAGDNDSARGRDTLCTPIVDDCLTYGRSYGKGRYAEKQRPPPNAD